MSDRFRVELSGWTGLIDAVSPHLQSPELHLEKDGDRTFLVSSRFDAMSSRDEVMAEAQRALPLIVAAMRLAGLRPMPIQANRVEEQTSGGPQSTVYAFALSASAVIAAPGASTGNQPRPPAPIPVEIGLRDERVARALELFARDPTWYDLYKVLDVIEEDVGGEKAIAGKGWASRSALRRFTATANNLATLGSDARHAISAWQPPTSPMTIDDAVVLIGQVLSALDRDEVAAVRRAWGRTLIPTPPAASRTPTLAAASLCPGSSGRSSRGIKCNESRGSNAIADRPLGRPVPSQKRRLSLYFTS